MMTEYNFSNRTVFITGAGSGIGYQTALAFAEAGANIVATDINNDGLEALATELKPLNIQYRYDILDVTDEESYQNQIMDLVESNIIPDIIINNAGVGFLRAFENTSFQEWRTTLDINVLGVVFGCRLFMNVWKQHDIQQGHLVNISSMAAYTPVPNMAAYAASKYAVEGFSEVLRLELADTDITVSCIHPGVINTPIVHDVAKFTMPPEQIERLQKHYKEDGVTPESVAQDIVKGVSNKTATVLSGKGTLMINLLRRILTKSAFRKLIISEGRKIGFLPLK